MKDFHIRANKVKLTQELTPTDYAEKRVNAGFSIKMNSSDEVHIHLDGFVNRR